MRTKEARNHSAILRKLPSIESLLQTETGQALVVEIGSKRLTEFARATTNELRLEILSGLADDREILDFSREDFLARAEQRLVRLNEVAVGLKLRNAINATGVIVHTNLGRAPLSENAKQAIIDRASGYCSLEYDVATGKRGKRGGYAEQLLAQLTGAEDALIVNNCAAAAILVLTALCKGGEAIVSRGELVEIGGDFRVPDVMEQSGATLKEVGTTNRTKLSDYEKAISDETRLLVKVHPSNYRIVGFTSVPAVKELAELAHENDVLLYEDAGSGAIYDLSEFGLSDEPVISRSIADGADVVTFSGDKLVGSAQSGLIVGKRDVIAKLRKHPFYRALRASKLIYAALEATLESFLKKTHLAEIPVLQMLSKTNEEISTRVSRFAASLSEKLGGKSSLNLEIIEGNSVIGGGSAPMVQPVSKLIALDHNELSANDLELKLRLSSPPVITRILEDRVLLDLRTITEIEESFLICVLQSL